MANPEAIVEGFSLTHAQILDGSTDFKAALTNRPSDFYDLYGVDQASLEPDTGEYENEGDNTVLSTWFWLNYATVNVRGGYLSFPLMQTLTGQNYSSSGANATTLYEIDLWHEDSFNVGRKPMIVRMLSRDRLGVLRNLDIGLYSVQFMPMKFDGPQYKDGLKINYEGRAMLSDVDELGAAHADGKRRVGRLLSRQAI